MESTLIVGGGVIGTSVAYHLRDRGAAVTLLEKNSLGAGTTAASMGRFNWEAPDPFGIAVQREAWRTYGPAVEEGAVGFERCGYLRVAGTGSGLESMRETASALRSYGLDFEVLDPGETAGHGLDPGAVAGGLYHPDGGYLNQQDAVEWFAGEARSAGVGVETGVEVTDVRVEDGTVSGVGTTEGDYAADVVVNAAGPWAPELNGMAGVSLPLRHTTGPILVLDAGEPLSVPFLKDVGGKHYFRPEGESKALAGRRWGSYREATLHDPDAQRAVGEELRGDVAALVDSHVPALADAEVINEWFGLRTVTPDFRPVVGPTRVNGFVVACGMSGAGVGLAPVVGRAVADHVRGEGGGLLGALSARRFGRGTDRGGDRTNGG